MYLRGLFVSPEGLLMAGLNPYRSGARVQVEALEHGHWHRFATPALDADYYDFAWTGTRLVAAFPAGGGTGQALDPKTGDWSMLSAQPAFNDGGGWWEESSSGYGPRILKRGDLFNASSGRTLALSRPQGSGPGQSVGLAKHGVYVIDSASRVWWQPT
jgi:hypothetical protein